MLPVRPISPLTTLQITQPLVLLSPGDVSVISRHPNFRLVAAMNPATDAGKRDLPPQLRSRFTEFWVGEPRSRSDLGQMVGSYLAGAAPAPPVEQVVDFYLEAKAEAVRVLSGRCHVRSVCHLPIVAYCLVSVTAGSIKAVTN